MPNGLEFVNENVDPMSLESFHKMADETTPELLSTETDEHLMIRPRKCAAVDVHCIMKEGERRKHSTDSVKIC